MGNKNSTPVTGAGTEQEPPYYTDQQQMLYPPQEEFAPEQNVDNGTRPSILAKAGYGPTTTPSTLRPRRQPCILCRKKLRVFYLISLAFGIGCFFVWYRRIEKQGEPITDDSRYASERFKISSVMVATLGLLGFIILVAGVSSMFVGILYMFAATALLYFCVNAVATASYSLANDNFDDIIDHAVQEYRKTQKFPLYLANVHENGKCCGFGIIYTRSWAKLLKTRDIPDSCCLKQFPGCGKDLLTDGHSGTLYSIQTKFYDKYILPNAMNKSIETGTNLDDIVWHNCTEEILTSEVYKKETNVSHFGVPETILRKIDEYFVLKNSTPPLCRVWEYNRKIDLFLYQSRGLDETRRIRDLIYNTSCQSNANDLTDTKSNLFFKTIEDQMKFIAILGGIQALLCVIMAVLFWHYYSKIQANILAELQAPRDFQELDIEGAAFEGENTYDDADDALAAKLVLKEKLRRDKLEKKHLKRLLELEAAEAAKALAAAGKSSGHDKKRRRRKGEGGKRKGGKHGGGDKDKHGGGGRSGRKSDKDKEKDKEKRSGGKDKDKEKRSGGKDQDKEKRSGGKDKDKEKGSGGKDKDKKKGSEGKGKDKEKGPGGKEKEKKENKKK